MSLPLVTRFGADPLLDLEVANKRYVDNSSGGTGQTFARIVKKLDETITSDTTLHDDDELFVAVNASKTYYVLFALTVTSHAAADWKFATSTPSGSTATQIVGRFQSNGMFGTNDPNVGVGSPTDNTVQMLHLSMRVITTTAGNIQFQWAQNISNGNNTTVNQGAFMVVWEETD